ncbi:hypothetical protein E1218_35015 [Kribbella turkmenica]|uniref:Integrase SAM-like N-terminal domain-containing protein n=1 Tax=Kribbella turkmenica TaxID=2530375 RepID=A0A4R4W3D9_9ACTN|nr:hypothetical protein [Kribbella turkmenica]TDD13058.1 hypothetical protein E1218_35015 [Kribbella turkmenica]
MTAVGTTKSAARTALLTNLQNRARTNHSAELTTNHKVNHLLHLWKKRFEGLVVDRRPPWTFTAAPSRTTSAQPSANSTSAKPPPRVDTVLTTIKDHTGASTAKTCRAVISGAMKLAVRYGAANVNPAREVDPIEANPRTHPEPLPPTKSPSCTKA